MDDAAAASGVGAGCEPPPGEQVSRWERGDAETVRDLIKHESEVTDHRLTWLVTLHGFLFAALGFAWEKGRPLIPVLAVLGIATSVSMMFPLYCADAAIRDLVRRWDEHRPEEFRGPDVIGYRPVSLIKRLMFPWFMLPGILAVAWVVVWCLA